MVKEVSVEGYEAFKEAVGKEEGAGKPVYVHFSGSVGAGGESWCPDCVRADPVIKEALKSAPADAIFIHCGVGGRDFWKDKSNIFRTDPQLRLTGVPTLLKWGTNQRLGDADCSKKELVAMMFEED